MPLRTRFICQLSHINTLRIVRLKKIVLLGCSTLLLSLLWLELVTRQNAETETSIQEALESVGRDLRYFNVYRKTNHLPHYIKYVLLWTRRDVAPFHILEEGQRSFLKNNCSLANCYITADKMFFGGDYTKFDAIAFNGRNMNSCQLPRNRSRYQKYIFFNTESADNFPICDSKFDGFFNLTATYKLDSDVPLPYLLIRDENHAIVSPKRRTYWRENMEKEDHGYSKTIENKTKLVAWSVSKCRTKSNRRFFVEGLQKALSTYGYEVDVFGSCGKSKCHRKQNIKKEYYFYLALENSFAEDYVTEKVLIAMKYNLIPVVYGGADYSRFLPPHSYIDGRRMHISKLASLMVRLAQSPKHYSRYFNWKKYYTYSPATMENVCSICEALNDETLMQKTTIYNNFRTWWTPNYSKRC